MFIWIGCKSGITESSYSYKITRKARTFYECLISALQLFFGEMVNVLLVQKLIDR